MTIESRFSVTVPNCSVQQWLFGSPSGHLPDRKVWIDADHPATRFFTLVSARALAKRIAVGLRDAGLQPGDRVLVCAGSSVVFPVLMFGIWMAGGIFTGANPACTARELAYQLEDSGTKIMLASEKSWDTAVRASTDVAMASGDLYFFDEMIPDVDHNVNTQRQTEHRHWTRLVACPVAGDSFSWHEPGDAASETCCLNYSSGTTGLPKGVEITHYNHIANARATISMAKRDLQNDQEPNHASALCVLPLYHAFCQGYYTTSFPGQGVPVYIMSSFDLGRMLHHIANLRITKLFVVPAILMGMTKHPLARKLDLSSLEMVGSGAAPLARETQKGANAVLFPHRDASLKQGFGMTELTCTALAWDPDSSEEEGVGELMPGCRAKLVDMESGVEILEPGVPGELDVSAPTMMKGYWRNSEATSKAISEGDRGVRWLRTGDIAIVNKYAPGAIFHIVDRAKDLIKVKGFQVSPSELEALILERVDVTDAAVVGVAVDGQEVPKAYVVLAQGCETSGPDIEAWLAERVAPYKRLKGGVVFLTDIPRNPVSGWTSVW
ncbi:4-coumarate--CoA ligase-like-like protein [Emericellopsis cladophorae]|uniref:4-coumarate--CoA ligase-like-like protein n=1 Tax=Emericellopsis cladophorae TaxID=2686198 RepID=A0A9P9Y661_9HYPO|nr:4-coumarate--CoA ligase-like-like protein [Emericellopsis cladophorae]KAI6784212.1 4-coumarate--CoA ligase-like-like protein [Emericellopsis cladophorae]